MAKYYKCNGCGNEKVEGEWTTRAGGDRCPCGDGKHYEFSHDSADELNYSVDYYEVIGLTETATAAQIKINAHKTIAKWSNEVRNKLPALIREEVRKSPEVEREIRAKIQEVARKRGETPREPNDADFILAANERIAPFDDHWKMDPRMRDATLKLRFAQEAKEILTNPAKKRQYEGGFRGVRGRVVCYSHKHIAIGEEIPKDGKVGVDKDQAQKWNHCYFCRQECLADFQKQHKGRWTDNTRNVYTCKKCGTTAVSEYKKRRDGSIYCKSCYDDEKLKNSGKTFCGGCRREKMRGDIWNRRHGFIFCSDDCYSRQLRKYREKYLDKLKKLADWNLLSTTEQDDFINRVNNDEPTKFKGIIEEAEQAIKKKKGSGDSSQARKNAISEIEKALRETGLTEAELNYFGSKTWRSDFLFKPINIDAYKQEHLNVIYRVFARRKIMKKLGENSYSVRILGVGDLREHFKNFSGKGKIEEEKIRLLDLIDNYGTKKEEKITDAKNAVWAALKKAGLENNPTQVSQILGADWENFFAGLSDDSQIEAMKNSLISKIDAFVSQNSTEINKIIAEIEQMLNDSGVSETILGANWKTNFLGKSSKEITAEKNRLLKLINQALEQSPEKLQKFLASAKTNATKKIKDELKKGHQKLIISENELPPELFAPHKNLTDKLNSLTKIEDITTFENNLLAAVQTKKKEKLAVIANTAIAEIKKELSQGNYELGQNQNYEQIIKSMVDPNDIERTKQNILALIAEQKKNAEIDQGNSSSETDNQRKFPFAKVLWITSLIGILLLISFILYKKTRKKIK